MKINTISPEKQSYLQIVSAIAKPPKKLHFIGKLPENRVETVAIVGTRKPTAYGKEVAHQLAYDLAKHGVIVISGLALGIDSIAHRAALEANGTTLAVLANGVDKPYPTSHTNLAREILKSGGALISEYEPGTPPLPHQFLARNRIVSGLADAVIVVEAAQRSGTLSTVNHALEQGKDVFAVPGNITSPLSAGCNALIKQGAQPITSADDVLQILKPQFKKEHSQIFVDTPTEQTILDLLQQGVRDGDELLEKSELNASEFNQTLSMLEIKGIVRALGANQWTVK